MKRLRCKVIQIVTYTGEVPLTPEEVKQATTSEEYLELLRHNDASWDLRDVVENIVPGTVEILGDDDADTPDEISPV